MILFQVRTRMKTPSAYCILALSATPPMLDTHAKNMLLTIQLFWPKLAGFRLIYCTISFSLLLQSTQQIPVSSILQQNTETCAWSTFSKGTISSYLPHHTDSFLTCMHRKSYLRMNNCKLTTWFKTQRLLHTSLFQDTLEEKTAIITFTFPCKSHWILCYKENTLNN